MAKRRTFTAAFKARVAKEALRGDTTVRQIAAKHGVHPNQVSQWKRKASEGLVQLFERGGVATLSRLMNTRSAPPMDCSGPYGTQPVPRRGS